MARIFIVEDEVQIGLLIEMTVKKAGHEAVRMMDAAELDKAIAKKDVPDLLLLDLMLREKNGFSVLREWKERLLTRNIPVIILSARASERDKVTGLELGAEDYVTKPFGVRELQARIAAALRRIPQAPEKIAAGPMEILPQSHDVYVSGKRIDLTDKEFNLLLYLVRSEGVTVPRGTLIREVWGYPTEDDPSRTVDSHVKTLRLKLGDAAALIQTVRGTGYRFSREAGA